MGFSGKKGGKRMMLSHSPDGSVIASNRNGLEYAIPQCIVDSVLALPASQFALDGEQIGDSYYVFDILSLNGRNLRNASQIVLPRRVGRSNAVSCAGPQGYRAPSAPLCSIQPS